MRHLWSLLAGLVAAPLAWLFLAAGQHGAQRSVPEEAGGTFDAADLVGPTIFLLTLGIVLGVLGTLRWSPAGPAAAGVLLALPGILMLAGPRQTLEAFSYPDDRRLLGVDFVPWLPVANGTMLVLGVLLLMAVFSIQRWRRWPSQPAPLPPASDDEVVAGVKALTGETGTGRSAPMTDDEILAAAAYEEQTTIPGGPLPGAPPTTPHGQAADRGTPPPTPDDGGREPGAHRR